MASPFQIESGSSCVSHHPLPIGSGVVLPRIEHDNPDSIHNTHYGPIKVDRGTT